MPRDMFGDVVNPRIKLGSQKWYTVPLSILAHVVIFGAVIIIPLMAADVLPDAADDDGVRRGAAASAAAPAAAARGRAAAQGGAAAGLESQRGTGRGTQGDCAGSAASRSASGVTGGVEGGVPGGAIGGVVGGLPEAPPPPRRRRRGAGPRRREHQDAEQDQGRQARLSAHRPVGARLGDRHHRGDNRRRRQGQGREGAALDPAARPGRARRGQTVAVHADAAQRRARARHHDGHGEFHAAVTLVHEPST